MSLTVSIDKQDVFGNKRFHHFTLGFDSSYPTGGESLTPRNLGLSGIDHIQLEPGYGFLFEYDYTNEKIKVMGNIPPIVFEETVTVTANVGTLRYPAAFIMSVSAGAQPYLPIPGGLVPATTQVAISNYTETFTPGPTTLTFLAADAVTTCTVTYATQAWRELVDNYVYAKLTAGVRVAGHASLAFTAGTPDSIDLGEAACAIASVLWNDNGTYKACIPCYKGVTAATTEFALDWANATNTTLEVLQTDTWDAATDSIYIIYIRKPASGFLTDRFIEEDDLTPATDIVTLSPGGVPGILTPLLWGTAGYFPSATTKSVALLASNGTIGTNHLLIRPTLFFPAGITAATFTCGSDHDDAVHIKPSYIWGYPWEIMTVPCEVPNAINLSILTGVRGFVVGF